VRLTQEIRSPREERIAFSIAVFKD